jgi:hypothetical protein
MTKRIWVLLPCLVVALVFAGCTTDGDPTVADQTAPPGEEKTLSRSAMNHPADADLLREPAFTGMDKVTRDPLRMTTKATVVDGEGLHVSTVNNPNHPELNPDLLRARVGAVTAKAMPGGIVQLKSGDLVAHLQQVTVDGVTHTVSTNYGGTPAFHGDQDFPRLVDYPEVGRVVIMVDGSVILVE